MSLIGTLSEIPLADVLRLFASGHKSGLVTVAAAGREALLRLDKGRLVHAVSGRLAGEAAVLDLFGWTEGQLTFVPDEKVVEANVSGPLEALIEEGLREGPLLHRMNTFFNSDRLVFQMAASPPEGAICTMGTTEWSVLRVLDGRKDLREVIAAAGMGRLEVQRVLFALADAGFLEKLELHRTLRVQALARFGATGAEVDAKLEEEWRRSMRFSEGVLRVEVRAGRDRMAVLVVAFRPGLARQIGLPKATLAELGVREGDELTVRPAV
jgi:uncharacterized protein DUF4388